MFGCSDEEARWLAYVGTENTIVYNNLSAEEKAAVQSGYWNLFRYDPRRAKNGENPLVIDSKAPTKDYKEFLMGETRYINLEKKNPERAAKLFNNAAEDAKAKYERLKKLSEI